MQGWVLCSFDDISDIFSCTATDKQKYEKLIRKRKNGKEENTEKWQRRKKERRRGARGKKKEEIEIEPNVATSSKRLLFIYFCYQLQNRLPCGIPIHIYSLLTFNISKHDQPKCQSHLNIYIFNNVRPTMTDKVSSIDLNRMTCLTELFPMVSRNAFIALHFDYTLTLMH